MERTTMQINRLPYGPHALQVFTHRLDSYDICWMLALMSGLMHAIKHLFTLETIADSEFYL